MRTASMFVVLALWLVPANVTDATGPSPARYPEGQVVVKLRADVTTADSDALAQGMDATVLRRLPTMRGELWRLRGETVAQAVRRCC